MTDKAAVWIKAINEAKTDKEVLKLWDDMLEIECGELTPSGHEVFLPVLEIHEAIKMRVVKAALNSRKDEERQ